MKIALDEKGQALIATVILSIFFILGYFGFQAYWHTRIQAQTKFKEAIALMDTMDKAAGDIRNNWDAASVAALAAFPPPPTLAQIVSKMAAFAPDQTCKTACPANTLLCYGNPNNINNPFCFFSAINTTTASLDFKLVLPEEKKPSISEKYFEKFGELLVGVVQKFQHHGLIENQAFAAPTVIQTQIDTVGATPSCLNPGTTCIPCCSPGAPGCLPNTPVCSTIYTCPSDYPQCAAYAGAAPGGANGAIFVQQFSITPSGGN